MSIASWGLIAAKGVAQCLRNKRATRFRDFFWHARSRDAVQAELNTHGAHDPFSHLSAHALHAQAHHARHGAAKLSEAGTANDFITRTIKKVLDEETTRLESGLTTLATVGATAPFVGLFGTVWGVYHALLAIGMSGAGTLDKVAGPVGEALIMTGIGLAVAIPAVIAYNAFTRGNRVLAARLDAFAYELHSFLTLGEAPGAGTTAKPAAEEAALPVVRVKAAKEPQGKDAYQATETRIGKGKQDIRDIPQSLTVATEKLIDDRNLDNVKELLKNTAGISFQAAEGGEEDIKIHGISLQGTGDIFIDGMRDPAFYDRDTFFVGKVELLRGSSGGAVNQVAKQAQPADRNQIDVTGYSHGGLRVVGDSNKRSGETTAWRMATMVNRADNDGAGTLINKAGLAGSLRTGIGEADEFAVTLYALQNENGMNYGMPWIRPTASAAVTTALLPPDPTAYYGLGSDRNKGSATYVMGQHTRRFSPDVELVSKARYASYTRDQRAGTVRFAAANLQPGGVAASLQTFGPNTVLARGKQLKVQDLQTISVQSDLSAEIKAAGMEHHLVTGVDFAPEKKQVYTDILAGQGGVVPAKPNTTVGTPNDGAWINEGLRTFRTNNDYVSKGCGAHLQDLASFLWIESMVRADEQRRLLYEMDMSLMKLRQAVGETPGLVQLTGTYHNLLRMWADT